MKLILKDGRHHMLRFDRGEEVKEGLKKFCEARGIRAASFTMIGAVSDTSLSWFDLANKTYRDEDFTGEFEITGVTGNISRMGTDTVIHMHGNFSGSDFKTFSGHVKRLVVSVTAEVFLIALDGTIERGPDKTTGLNLML